jgi:hypothetical protein
MWDKHDYQDHDLSIVSSVTLEVKGIENYGNNSRIILDNAD